MLAGLVMLATKYLLVTLEQPDILNRKRCKTWVKSLLGAFIAQAIWTELSSASSSYSDHLLSCTELQMSVYLNVNDNWFSVSRRVGCCFEEITFLPA